MNKIKNKVGLIADYITRDKNGRIQIKDKATFMMDWLGSYPSKYETGIYMIGSFYIGKGDIRNRVFSHFRKSIQGIHENKSLQNRIMCELAKGKPIGLKILSNKNTCHEERKLIKKYSLTCNLCNII